MFLLLILILILFLFLKCHPERSEGPKRGSNRSRGNKVTFAVAHKLRLRWESSGHLEDEQSKMD